MKNEELCFMPATEMAAAIKQKKTFSGRSNRCHPGPYRKNQSQD